MICSTSLPTYPTSVKRVASTFTNGALARVARRRAISVLPTPVGPIIRMFLGITSLRSSSGSCARRQRLRSAIATARLAEAWPTMWRSSSCTIWRGVMVEDDPGWFMYLPLGRRPRERGGRAALYSIGKTSPVIGTRQLPERRWPFRQRRSEFLDHHVAIGVDADVAGDIQRLGGDGARVEPGVRKQCARGRQRVAAARADGDEAVLRLDHVAGAADDQRGVLVGHRQQCLELAETAFGAPILGHFHRGALQLAVLGELGFEQLEQGEGIGGGTGEARQHLAVVAEPAHLARVTLHHGVAKRDLAIAGHGHLAVATHRQDRGGVEHVGILAGVHAASGAGPTDIGAPAA